MSELLKTGEVQQPAELRKIGDIAVAYNVSSRTLRYYEEIGILQSTRLGNSQYRYYNSEAINRLEQIMTLKKLQLSIKDIREILSSQDMQVAVEAFTRKLQALEKDIEAMSVLKQIIADFLELLKEKGYNRVESLKILEQETRLLASELPDDADGCCGNRDGNYNDNHDGNAEKSHATDKDSPSKNPSGDTPAENAQSKKINTEGLNMLNENIRQLTDNDVRIIKLKPMRVAFYRAESANPEMDAWDVLYKWVKEQGLENLFTTRYFGFNNPSPKPGNPVYGYEVWVTVLDNVQESGDIKIKNVEGGLYAVTSTFGPDIPQNWHALSRWVKDSKYEHANDRCLEEHLFTGETPFNDNFEVLQLDLYLSVQEK